MDSWQRYGFVLGYSRGVQKVSCKRCWGYGHTKCCTAEHSMAQSLKQLAPLIGRSCAALVRPHNLWAGWACVCLQKAHSEGRPSWVVVYKVHGDIINLMLWDINGLPWPEYSETDVKSCPVCLCRKGVMEQIFPVLTGFPLIRFQFQVWY